MDVTLDVGERVNIHLYYRNYIANWALVKVYKLKNILFS